jgi:hypothetical protein
MNTYNFGTHWVTTEEILTGYIECFDVTLEEAESIDNGANLESVDGVLNIDTSTEQI